MSTAIFQRIDEAFNTQTGRQVSRGFAVMAMAVGLIGGLITGVLGMPLVAAAGGLLLGLGLMTGFAAQRNETPLRIIRKEKLAATVTVILYPAVLAGLGYFMQDLQRQAVADKAEAARVAKANNSSLVRYPS